MKCSQKLKDYENGLPHTIKIERVFGGFSATDGKFEITIKEWDGTKYMGWISDIDMLKLLNSYHKYKGEERYEPPED